MEWPLVNIMKLKSKTYRKYTGKVYDLSVENKSSYNVEGFPVHNSGAGSLVCYLLGITQVDPIKHGLLFERFLSKKKACLGEDSWVLTYTGPKQLKNIKIGDRIKTHTGKYFPTVAIDLTKDRTDWYEITYGYWLNHTSLGLKGFHRPFYSVGKLIASSNHKFITAQQFNCPHIQKIPLDVKYKDVSVEFIKSVVDNSFTKTQPRFYGNGSDNKTWEIFSIEKGKVPLTLIDIKLEADHTFWVSDKKDGVYVLSHNSLPDIDSDCADREEAIKILIEHFGEECVLPVSNYNQLQLKSLIKDLARLYQIPFEEINPITQKIEKETLDEDKKQDGFDRGVWFLSYESAEKNSPTFNKLLEDYPQLEASIKVLFKQIKSCFTEDTLLLTNSGWKKYSEITEQDKIAFIDNVGEIQYSSDFFKVENGEKEVYKIETLDGKVLELTEDHLVQTDKGWKQVKDLTNEDSLIGWI